MRLQEPLFNIQKFAWLKILAVFVLGLFLGFTFAKHKFSNPQINALLDRIQPLRANQNGFPLIQLLLAYKIPKDIASNEYSGLLNQLTQTIEDAKKTKEMDSAAVYFRDLNTGHWTGINEEDQYEPASLFKIIVMISYFKLSEHDPEILSKKLTYTAAINSSSEVPFQAPSVLEVGKTYTIEDLVKTMVVNSDNGALYLLLSGIDQNDLLQVFSILGIQQPQQKDYKISARAYSLFFRILFNATYLNQENSEKALELLSQTQFKDGLISGVPDNVNVAHKFGKYAYTAGDQNTATDVGLHDCGIVYFPGNPYLLCVMTKGKNVDTQTQLIKTISQLAYGQIEKKNAK